MAQNKSEVISIGKGGLQSKLTTSRVFASTVRMDVWDVAVTYPAEAAVEYSGAIYKSKIAGNLALQPDTNDASWEKVVDAVHDGDMCVVVLGNKSDLQERVAGTWISIGGQPKTIALVDGQIAPALAFQYDPSGFPYAKIEYTIRRGSGHNRKRRGEYIVLTDGSSAVTTSHSFEDLGSDVGVTLSVQLDSGLIKIYYTSLLDGNAIEFAVCLKGWS